MNTQEPTIKDVMSAISSLAKTVESVRDNGATKDDMIAIRSEMATKDDMIAIRSEMATKDDIADVRVDLATKQDLNDLRDEVIDHVDTFIGKYRTHETELAAVSFRQQRTERRVEHIAKHLKLNINSV